VNVLFDHNVSPYIARALAVLANPDGHRVHALVDKFGDASVSDADWLRELGRDGSWIVISGDRRIAGATR
jgi:PIN domain-containing protein